MCLQNLPHIHPRGHTQRIQYDVDRLAVFIVRHVLYRHNHGDNTLVTVTARHFVTHLQLALRGNIDFYLTDNTAAEEINKAKESNGIFEFRKTLYS